MIEISGFGSSEHFEDLAMFHIRCSIFHFRDFLHASMFLMLGRLALHGPQFLHFACCMHFHFVRAFVFSCFLFRVLGRPPWPTSAPVHVCPHGESRRELTLAREGPSWPTSASVRSPWFSGLILVVIFLEWSWTVGRVVLRPQGVVSFGCLFPCATPGPTPVQLRALGPGPGRFVSGGPGCPPGTPPFPTPPGHFWPRVSLPPGLWEVPYEGHRPGFVLFCCVLFGCWPVHGPCLGLKK